MLVQVVQEAAATSPEQKQGGYENEDANVVFAIGGPKQIAELFHGDL